MPKQRGIGGRTRMTSRLERRAPAAVTTQESRLAEARRAAIAFAADHWPELAEIDPVSTVRRGHIPPPELLARLGLSHTALAAAPRATEYSFTFIAEQRTADGTTTPLVAIVTVDEGCQVVKASVSH